MSWNQKDIEFKNKINKMKYRSMKKDIDDFEWDKEKDCRLEKQHCKTCHYLNRHKGHFQAFTTSVCCGCGKEMTFATSDQDKLCANCRKERNLCIKCGGTLD